MFISRGTVKVHLSHVSAKLAIKNQSELAAEATRREGTLTGIRYRMSIGRRIGFQGDARLRREVSSCHT